MRIADEIIRMLEKKRGKDAAPKANGKMIKDNGGRRSETDRRASENVYHLTERRVGEDRRIGLDRRTGAERRNVSRSTAERRASFAV